MADFKNNLLSNNMNLGQQYSNQQQVYSRNLAEVSAFDENKYSNMTDVKNILENSLAKLNNSIRLEPLSNAKVSTNHQQSRHARNYSLNDNLLQSPVQFNFISTFSDDNNNKNHMTENISNFNNSRDSSSYA